MFGTIIWDVYKQSDTAEVHEALEDVASARDTYGWSSSGVYAFSSAEMPQATHPLLYLGLASDLSSRFAQHNGLVPSKPGSSKKAEIEAWFGHHDLIGFAAFVQSPMHQAHTSSFVDAHDQSLVDWTENFEYDKEAREAIALVEGMLIESVVMSRGQLPRWNKIGGSKAGQSQAHQSPASDVIRLLEGTTESLFVARRSIRELSADNTSMVLESDILHAARMSALAQATPTGASDSNILEHVELMRQPGTIWFNDALTDHIDHMQQSGYLNSSTR